MPSFKPCPKCHNPLEIPDPPQEQFHCSHCGAAIGRKKERAAAPSEGITAIPAAPAPVAAPTGAPGPSVEVPASGSGRGVLIALGLIGGLILLAMIPVACLGTAWFFDGESKKTPHEVMPKEIANDNSTPKKKVTPPDPRIKIVQPSVDKGVAYLKKQIPSLQAYRGGYLGLIGLTLLECGVPPDDPAILKIAEYIRKGAPGMSQVYDLAASLFFLNRWHELRPLDEKDGKMARGFALRIIAGQVNSGIWGYQGVVLAPDQEAKLLTSLRAGTYQPTGARVVSMSNTQFAMLAVWGARKHGVPVRAPLLALAAYFHANQNPDGSWNYPNHSLKATSTCAGLISLAIEMALLEDKEFNPTRRVPEVTKKKKQADVEKAFAFVAKTIGRKLSDPVAHRQYGGRLFNADAGGDLYFLWTLERVGVIYSKEVIAGKNWYDWGYPIVMKAQQPDGKWNEGHGVLSGGPLSDTPFALLFLKRANIARDLTEFIRTRGESIIVP
ncbi:MAG: hypothetical protein HYX68_14465 [Planctomycetes bacterium]|nr:hypothetical protein [Planctomycetota bacterium]